MRSKLHYNNSFALIVVVLAILLCAGVALAQTSSSTYQGRLTDARRRMATENRSAQLKGEYK